MTLPKGQLAQIIVVSKKGSPLRYISSAKARFKMYMLVTVCILENLRTTQITKVLPQSPIAPTRPYRILANSTIRGGGPRKPPKGSLGPSSVNEQFIESFVRETAEQFSGSIPDIVKTCLAQSEDESMKKTRRISSFAKKNAATVYGNILMKQWEVIAY